MANNSKDVFFVCIKESNETRRAILKASKEVIIVLQRYEMFRRLREAKLKLMEDLSRQFREIHEITTKMNIELPTAKFETSEGMDAVKQTRGKGVMVKDMLSVKKEDTELTRLEASITDIEKKLQDME